MAYIPTPDEIESIAEWKRRKKEEHIRWASQLPQPFKVICLNPAATYFWVLIVILLYLLLTA